MNEQHTETRERFLAAIAERLEPETIAEAHIFPPIKQGGIESGVAVVAVNHRSLTGGDAAAEDRPSKARTAASGSSLCMPKQMRPC